MNTRNTLRLIQESMAIEAESAKEADAIGYMARLLVQATMPHSKTDDIKFKRSNGNITVAMTADPDVGLPYGHYPRLLLSWITTEAVRLRSPDLELGDSLSDFMEQLGLIPTGGRWGSVTRLRDHMRRLFTATVSWSYDSKKQSVDVGIRPVEVANLWWDTKMPSQVDIWKSCISLNKRFYEELINRPVPIDMRALAELAREKSPLAIDIYMWLTYRMSYLKEEITIPWEALQLQFGGDYKLTRQFKAKFLGRLKVVKHLYPEAKVVPQDDGLTLWPSPTHMPTKSRVVTIG